VWSRAIDGSEHSRFAAMVSSVEPQKFYTPRQFALMINSSKQHVLNLVHARRIPAHRLSERKILIPSSALDAIADAAFTNLAPEIAARVAQRGGAA
jgi:excisionase family DNA binding protein